ncbi:MAG: pyrroline-5-carboxylate reductase [Dehalococcoidia bacterium]|nr:pyrroline-5-carboxylate reductase [Dehalococcoidia bacterium]
MKLAFLGGGTMAEAIITGVLKHRLAKPSDITVGEPMAPRREYLHERYAVVPTAHNAEAIAGASLVVLAVKPQVVPEVMSHLRGVLRADQTVLSIVAGARMGALQKGLQHQAVIRVMPNTPAQVGAGMSVWTASPAVSQPVREEARSVLQALGEEVYVADEHLLDMATAINGSGPAYVFKFIEALIDAGVYLGMPRDTARQLVLQTVLGSALMMKTTGKHPAELQNMVTSPGGTTAEALLVLESRGFDAALIHAVKAAYEKSKALGEES